MFNVFEPKLVDSLLYAMIEFVNHGIQGTATWSQLSLVPHQQYIKQKQHMQEIQEYYYLSINNCFTNKHHTDHTVVILPINITDHFPIMVLVASNDNISYVIVNKYTTEKCVYNMQTTSWDDVFNNDDVNSAYNLFISKLNS